MGGFDDSLGGERGRGMVLGGVGEERTNEEKISPKNAFSFPMSGSVFVNSVCALA